MMKNYLYLVLFIVSAFFASCTSKDEVSSSDVKERMFIYVTDKDIESDKPIARLVVDYGEWVMLDVTSDGCEHPEGHAYYFVHKFSKKCIMAYGTPKAIVFAKMTDDSGYFTSAPEQVLVATEEGNGYRMSQMYIYNGGYEVSNEILLSGTSGPHKMPQARPDYMDEYQSMVFEHMCDFYNKVGERVAYMTELPGLIWSSVGEIGTIWTSYAVIGAKRMVYVGNPNMERNLGDRIREEETRDLISVTTSTTASSLAKIAYNLIMQATPGGALWKQQSLPYQDEYAGETYLPMFSSSRVADMRYYTPSNEYAEVPAKYAVKASLGSVSETTVDVKASWDCIDGSMSYISSMGYAYYADGDTYQHEVTVDNISGTYTVSGLQPFTAYRIAAFVRSFGTTYYSEWMPFITKGELHPTPSSLHFKAAGGMETVSLGIPSSVIQSWNVSAPSWCAINKSDAAFSVSVDVAQKAHKGTIKISVTLNSGVTKTASVAVQQDAPAEVSKNWNGTSWRFDHDRFGFSISFYDVANQSMSCSGFINSSWNFDLVQLSNGNLDLQATDSGGSLTSTGLYLYIHECYFLFHRTGPTTATVTLTYMFNDDGKVSKGKVKINGVLIQ